MKELDLTKEMDLTIVGGGPAGLAAAVRAKQLGIQNILLLERDVELGGILNQCIHDGFGLLRFKKQLSGAQYAQIFVDMVQDTGIHVLTGSMASAFSVNNLQKTITISHSEQGTISLKSKSVILAMGCRERTRSQVRIMGSRPAGVMTAGAVQKYINISGYLPGQKAVILGSGDIGLIMARRMHLEGMEVEGVYEVMPSPGGLRRNVVQCLNDYGIPLHLSTTVVKTHGDGRLNGVTVAQVDVNRRPISGSERFIECDLLVLSVGLIPENELSLQAGIDIESSTGGPAIDNYMMTKIPGVFASGNVSAVFDLVDYVSETGEMAAEGAFKYLSKQPVSKLVNVLPGDNVSVVLPQKIRADDTKGRIYLRVNKVMHNVELIAESGGKQIAKTRHAVAAPPEMLSLTLPADTLDDDICISVRERE